MTKTYHWQDYMRPEGHEERERRRSLLTIAHDEESRQRIELNCYNSRKFDAEQRAEAARREDEDTIIRQAQQPAATAEVLTVTETAALLRCDSKAIYALIEAGQLKASDVATTQPGKRHKARYRIARADVDEFLARRQKQPTTSKKPRPPKPERTYYRQTQ